MNAARYFIASSRTGVLHAPYIGSYNATPCNSRNSGFYMGRVTAAHAKRAAAESWCKKCFPQGKPTDEQIDAACARTR